MKDPQIAVRVKGLQYTYIDRTKVQDALKGLDFDIPRGKITGILGPNGSGKTTTFKILSTQLLPASGDAHVNGFSVSTQRDEVRRQLGVTFQSPSLDPILSIRENLEIHALLLGMRGPAAAARIDEVIQALGLKGRESSDVKSLSGGLARRAELAKTLLNKPDVLLLDEPTTGLDPRARNEFWDILRGLRNEGRTLLVTTHLMDEAEQCDHLIFLNEGLLAATGTPAKLKEEFGRDVLIVDGEGLEEDLRAFERSGKAERFDKVPEGYRIESRKPNEIFEALRPEMGGRVRHLQWGKATLGDVYLGRTGKKL